MAGQLTTTRPTRSLFPWSERDPFTAMRHEMDDLFARFLGNDDEWTPTTAYSPRIDMCETDDQIQLRVDVPGIQPGEIDLQFRGGNLTISGERKCETKEGETTIRCERPMGKFSRTISLPCAVKEDEIDAQDCNGVLTVTLEKAEPSKTRKIEIKT